MEFNSPSKRNDFSTPPCDRPRTRSVASQESFQDARRTLSLDSDDESNNAPFDLESFVDGYKYFLNTFMNTVDSQPAFVSRFPVTATRAQNSECVVVIENGILIHPNLQLSKTLEKLIH